MRSHKHAPKIRTELEAIEKRIITLLRNSESAHVSDFSNGLQKKFELTQKACLEDIQQLCESIAYKIIFCDLRYSLWDNLYVGGPTSSPIEPFLRELEHNLTVIADTVHHERVRTRLVAEMMKTSFEGVLLVLLGGGPSRCFSVQDVRLIKDDFEAIKDLLFANGDGLPMDVISNFSVCLRDVISVLGTDTDNVIERFRRLTLEVYGSSAKSRLPLPATMGQWSSNDPNMLLCVLCYRNDDSASKFLKKTYNLPKRLCGF